MVYSLFYYDDVKQDIREVKKWYKAKEQGLEKRFANTIKSTLLELQSNTFAYAIRYKNIRIAHPKIFPYGIHFYINESINQIVIIGVIHHKKNLIQLKKIEGLNY